MTADTALLFGGGGAAEVDERVVAQAAVDAAEEQLQSLCASHAGTFVGVERRWRATQENLSHLLACIASAQEQVGIATRALDPGDDDDHDASKKETSLAFLSEQHRVRRRTLLQHSSLLELLELPSLMDACVRSSLYEEALSIAAFANTLERRHGGGGDPTSATATSSNAVVSRVVQQIRGRQGDLRGHLLSRLKSQVTMPVCLEVVTSLRRLNSIDLERSSSSSLERIHAAMEFQLQVEFLEARDSWLESSSSSTTANTTIASTRASLGSMQPTEQLLDAIERYRTRVFEVATQFNAIFRAQPAAESSAASLSLLSMWLGRRIHAFLTLLSTQLHLMEDSASLRDALEASVFFATSMGRLGADFTPQLGPIFEPRMLALVAKHWKDGAVQLTETLSTCRQAQVNFPLVAIASSSTTETTSNADSNVASTEGDGDVMSPPRQLLTWPPLARFVNAVLSGLNELRRCLLPGIFSSLVSELAQVLASTRLELVAHERAVLVPGFRGEAAALRETAARYLEVWDELVNPYLQGSLYAALGQTAQAETHYRVLKVKEAETDPIPEANQVPLISNEEEGSPTDDKDEQDDNAVSPEFVAEPDMEEVRTGA